MGILSADVGAEVSATATALMYDDVVALYFSVKPKYRKNGKWLMNDETAYAIRKIKDKDGNYIWNHNNDTILVKEVLISEYMPNTTAGNSPIAFGDFTPFLNIINEWYAKDTSKKIRAVFKAKGEAGKPLCTIPPYGYVKYPEYKHHWIIEETAANVVRRIFNLCVDGYGPSQIAGILEQDKILVPSAYYKSLGISYPAAVPENPYAWQSRTIADILAHPEYLGHTVNFKTYKKSYKSKKKLQNDP